MRSCSLIVVLSSCFLSNAATPIAGGQSGQAQTTRYYDSCKPSSSWPGKTEVKSALKTVKKDGSRADQNAPNGCETGSDISIAAFTDPAQMPRIIDAQNAIAYAAVGALNGHGERDTACACYELTFVDTAIAGQKLVVQVTNTGGDLNSNHFDIMMPGSGVGIFTEGVVRQFGPDYKWGAGYGGVASAAECFGLPQVLQEGCRFRFGWFKGADNPRANFQQVHCPASLTDVSTCVRADAAESGTAACPNKQYQQCGGQTFHGNSCCPSGTSCVYTEPYYSYCKPAASPAAQACTNQKWAQCGGKDYTGQKCCPTGSSCKFINDWYSQCQ
jgi:hypothetical protein